MHDGLDSVDLHALRASPHLERRPVGLGQDQAGRAFGKHPSAAAVTLLDAASFGKLDAFRGVFG